MVENRTFALGYRIAALIVAVTGFLTMMGVFGSGWNFSVLAFYTLQSNVFVIVLFIMLVVRTIINLHDVSKVSADNGSGNNEAGDDLRAGGVGYFARFKMVCSINIMLTIRTTNGLREGKTGDVGYFARIEMVCSINIMLTFLVYWVLLAPRVFMMVDDFPIWTYANLAVHGFTPLLCLLDYILFTKPGHLKYRDVYYVCIFPLIYLIGTSIAGLMGYVYFISADDGLPIRFPYFFYDFDRIGMLAFAYIAGLVVFLVVVGHAFYFIDRAKKMRHKEELSTSGD